MPQKRETLSARVTRLEQLHADLAEEMKALAGQMKKLEEKVEILVDAQIETEKRFRETDERFKQTDERIDKLVSAIGEFIGRIPAR